MKRSNDYEILSINYITASFFASYFAAVMHPLDLIKTRFQSKCIFQLGHDGKTSKENLVPKYNGIKNALKMIYKDEGFKGLYKGFYISLLCQTSSMSFFFYE